MTDTVDADADGGAVTIDARAPSRTAEADVVWRWVRVLIHEIFETERGLRALATLFMQRSTVDVGQRRSDAARLGRSVAIEAPFTGPALLTDILFGALEQLLVRAVRLRITQSGVRFFDSDQYTLPQAALSAECCAAIAYAAQHAERLFACAQMMSDTVADDSVTVSGFTLDDALCDVARGGIDRCAVATVVYGYMAAAATVAGPEAVSCVVEALDRMLTVYDPSAAASGVTAAALRTVVELRSALLGVTGSTAVAVVRKPK